MHKLVHLTKRFLETVVGKGYRFVGDITVIPGTEPASPAAEAEMLNRIAVFRLPSVSSLPTFTLPLYSSARSSITGASMRHGPHHSAQKSTSTGSLDESTSSPKLASETCVVMRGIPFGISPSFRSGGCVIQKLGRVQRRFNAYHPMVKLEMPWRSFAAGKNINDSNVVHRIAASMVLPGKSWPAICA